MEDRTGAPPARRRLRLSRTRLAGLFVVGAALAWAIVQGAHPHDGPAPVEADLAGAEVSRVIVVDASTGELDLRGLEIAPGEVVEFVLDGSGGSGHLFLLSGLGGSEIDQRAAPNGDAVIRVRAPREGALSFYCAIPGHEGLHGSLVVDAGAGGG